jgi:hypothetical protein
VARGRAATMTWSWTTDLPRLLCPAVPGAAPAET